jgi:ribose/xylose/arabinose/galactoside ABC-type transport system permease subunit
MTFVYLIAGIDLSDGAVVGPASVLVRIYALILELQLHEQLQ